MYSSYPSSRVRAARSRSRARSRRDRASSRSRSHSRSRSRNARSPHRTPHHSRYANEYPQQPVGYPQQPVGYHHQPVGYAHQQSHRELNMSQHQTRTAPFPLHPSAFAPQQRAYALPQGLAAPVPRVAAVSIVSPEQMLGYQQQVYPQYIEPAFVYQPYPQQVLRAAQPAPKPQSQFPMELPAAEGHTFHFPRKFDRALQIGINYKGTSNELHGCIEDIENLSRHFDTWGIKFTERVLMTDDTPEKPTKANMMARLTWLVTNTNPGDTLFFQYSGHGSHEKAHDKWEDDGQDESLCPLDLETAGMLVDNEINTILQKLDPSCKLFWISDSCHSGSNSDLPYVLKVNSRPAAAPAKPQQQQQQPQPQPQQFVPGFYPNNPQPYPQHVTPYPQYPQQYVYPQQHVYPQQQYGIMSYFTNLFKPNREVIGTTRLGNPLIRPPGALAPVVTQTRPENCRAKIIALSGCRDDQTSQEFDGHGAMTTALLGVMSTLLGKGETIKLTDLLQELYSELDHQHTPQLPQITSSFPLSVNDSLSFAF